MKHRGTEEAEGKKRSGDRGIEVLPRISADERGLKFSPRITTDDTDWKKQHQEPLRKWSAISLYEDLESQQAVYKPSDEAILPPRNAMASDRSPQTPEEKREELFKLRRLQMVLSMTLSVLRQDAELTPAEAQGLAARCKSVALAMFPDKESVFDLIYAPRLEREIRARFPRNREIG